MSGKLTFSGRPTVVSFNRFEAKKNVALAIESFARIKDGGLVPADVARALRLVIGGGYDDSMDDNVDTLEANKAVCDKLGLTYHILTSPTAAAPAEDVDVLFILNFTTEQRSALLLSPHTLALLYTPTNEHFGIVPIEAMACGLPVLACNTGGPTETVVDFEDDTGNGTGFLRSPTADEWAPALASLINVSDQQRAKVAEAAKKRVRDHFSSKTLGRELEVACRDAVRLGDPQQSMGDKLIKYSLTLIMLSLGGLVLAAKLGSKGGQ